MQFAIHYDLALLKSTLNRYLLRRIGEIFGWTGLVVLAGLSGLFVYLLLSGDTSWLTGLLGAGLLLLGGFLVALWRAWHRQLTSKIAAMRSRQALVILDAEEIAVKADSGSFALRWDRFTGIEEFPGCWLLMIEPNNFISIPTEGIDPQALAYICAHINPAR